MSRQGFSYGNDPATSTLDEVRLLTGDTDIEHALLSDAEITYYLTNEGSALAAAIAAVQGILGQLARKVSYTTGRVSKSASDQFDHYTQLMDQLRSRTSQAVAPWAGGLSDAEKVTDAANTDLVQPYFEVDMLEDPNITKPTG